jgi:hypothetical protein
MFIFIDFISKFILLFCLLGLTYISNYIYKLYKLNTILKENNIIIICDIPIKYKIYFKKLCSNIFDIDDCDNIINFLILNKNNLPKIILDSDGGSISSNDRLLYYILDNKLDMTSYVLRKSYSAATLIALCSKNLYMDESAILSPTDPQINMLNDTYSVKSVMNLIDTKDINMISDTILLTYNNIKVTYEENINMTTKLLNKKFKYNTSKLNKKSIIDKFTSGDISHHNPISYKYLSEFLDINNNIPNIINDIYSIYFKVFY